MENCLNPLLHGGLDRTARPEVVHALLGNYVWGAPEEDGTIGTNSPQMQQIIHGPCPSKL